MVNLIKKQILCNSIMNNANTVVVAMLVALATTTGLVTALSVIGQTALAAGAGGGCGKGGCGGGLAGQGSSTFSGGFGEGGSSSGRGGGTGYGFAHCGAGNGGSAVSGLQGGGSCPP